MGSSTGRAPGKLTGCDVGFAWLRLASLQLQFFKLCINFGRVPNLNALLLQALMKPLVVSFYVANKNCHIQTIVRVEETTHRIKIGNFLMLSIDPSL